MNPADTYRDAFMRLVAEGMTCEEALAKFDEDDFRRVALIELNDKFVRLISVAESTERAGDWVTNDGRQLPALFDLLVRAEMEKHNGVHGADYQQALDLWQAGWTSESHGPQSQVMSWCWRRPSRRPGKLGRRYLTTNQAWCALQRDSPKHP